MLYLRLKAYLNCLFLKFVFCVLACFFWFGVCFVYRLRVLRFSAFIRVFLRLSAFVCVHLRF